MTTVVPPVNPRALDPVFFIVVGIGGAIGSTLRHGVLSTTDDTTVSVFVLNVVGSLLLGSLGGWLSNRPQRAHPGAATWSALIGLGFCGGLTTFSAHALDMAQSLRQTTSPGTVIAAVGSGLGTTLATVGAAAIGFGIGRRSLPGGAAQ